MWPGRLSNPGPLTYESALPTALHGPASTLKTAEQFKTRSYKNLSILNLDIKRLSYGISVIISVNENVCSDLMRTASCDPSLEPPRRGSPSEGSQHIFCADISIITLELSFNNSLNPALEHRLDRH